MKNTKVIKITAAMLSTIALSTALLSACQSEKTGDVDVWSTYNTLKVMQSKHDYPKLEAKISTELVIGETEGAQLLFTPETNIKSFELVAGELKSGENTFKAENIKIYVQKYINVLLKTHLQKNDAYPAGYIPDFLLPMELCKKNNENHSEAGNNQGFYVEFTADAETKAGTYTGTFQLKTDGKTTEIPVSVTVRDFTVSHSYGKSCFALYQNTLLYGELDSSDEMYTAYYETLMRDYKLMLMHVPYGTEYEDFADSVVKYYDEPQFTSYAFPTFGGHKQFSEEALNDYVYAVAKRCTPEKNYLEKGYIYPMMADEPQSADKIELMKRTTAVCDALDEVIIQRLDSEGFFDEYGGIEGEFAQSMVKALDGIECVITTDAIEGFGEDVDTYCPPIQYFSNDYLRELYEEHAEHNSGDIWYYTCMQPLYPYPSHHIDDYLIGMRSMRWMQMAYGLEGYLYWNSSYYVANIDPYNDPVRFTQDGAPYPGDGYLTYPGAKYEHYGPLPSLRLVAYRDGQEDYDLMRAYEELLTSVYGDEISVNDVLDSSYASMFGGAIYNPDDQTLLSERTLLLDRAEALASQTGLVAYTEEDGLGHKLVVYAKENSEIFVNGSKVNAETVNGVVKYTASVNSNVTVKAQNGDTVSELKLSVGKEKTAAVLSASALQMSDTSVVTAGENGLDLTLNGKGSTVIELNSFKPGFYLNASTFGGNLNKLQDLTFEFFNPEDKTYAIEIVFNMKDGTNITLNKYTVKPGENTIKIRNIPLYYGFSGKKPDRLRVIFPNTESGVAISGLNVTLERIAYTLNG